MFKFIDSIEVKNEGCSVVLRCGLHKAVMYDDGAYFGFYYEVDGAEYFFEYLCDSESLEGAIWEWLCTLSRKTNPDNVRTLGSSRSARAA